MTQQFRSPQDMQSLIRWVIACCVLHNILARLGDAWHDMYLEDDSYDEAEVALNDAVEPDSTASNFREPLQKVTLETNYVCGILPMQY